MQILALDVGTSSVKAAILDVATATPVGPVARTSYELDHPTADAAEVPAERLWSAVTASAREATATKGVVILRPKAVVDKTIKTPSLLALQSEAKKRGLDTLTPKKIEAVIARTRRAKARKSA